MTTRRIAWITGLSNRRTHYGVVVQDGEGWPYEGPLRTPLPGTDHCIAFSFKDAQDFARKQGAEEVLFSRPYSGEYSREDAARFLSRKSAPRGRKGIVWWDFQKYVPERDLRRAETRASKDA